jgi:hypothetical protein
MPVLNELLKALPEHQNFYLRGVLNSLLPDFIDPSDGVVNENNISGEALETLKIVVANLHPDIKEGQVKSIDYDDMMKVLGDKSIFEDNYNIDTIGDQIRNSLGEFGVTVEDGELYVFDTYDFQDRGGWKEFVASAEETYQTGSIYPVARYMGGKIMPENPDGTSREDALRVKIKLSKEQKVVNTDFDDDINPNATTFVFEGGMTNKRKQIFEKQFESQYAGGFLDNFFDTIKAPVEYLEDKNLQRRGNTYTPLGSVNDRRDRQKKDKGGLGERFETFAEQIGFG